MRSLQEKALFYRALGEENRLKIMRYLLTRRCVCICELGKLLGKDQSVAFRHIKLLEKAGIVSTDKQAKYLMCCIKDKETARRYLEG